MRRRVPIVVLCLSAAFSPAAALALQAKPETSSGHASMSLRATGQGVAKGSGLAAEGASASRAARKPEDAFLVDNGLLDASSPGLAYRATPNATDKVGGIYAAWGSKVFGSPVGKNWLKTENGYLPFNVNGLEVLFKADSAEAAKAAGIVTKQADRKLFGHVNYAAGMGGGGVYVPLLLLLLGLSTKEAVPLSQAMIVGGAIINIAMFSGDRHPKYKHRPKIDYDVVMMLNPGLAAGVTLGVMCGLMTPQWFLVVVLIMTLVLTLQKAWVKGVSSFKKESEQMAKEAAEAKPAGPPPKLEVRLPDVASFVVLAGENSRQLTLIVGCWSIFLLCNFFKAPACSRLYWLQNAVLLASCVVFTSAGADTIRNKASSKESSEGVLTWTPRTLWIYPLCAAAAGFLGGFLGIGGGIIMSPLLLELGMDAHGSQATSSMFVFLSSSLATIQFILLGKAMPEFAAWFTAWVIVSTYVGQTIVDYVLQRWKRSSLIVISVAAITAGSLVMMTSIGAKDIYVDVMRGADMGFRPMTLCHR